MSTFRPDNPLIVQGDFTVLVELDGPRYEEARGKLLAFAELVKSPEHVHTYRITPLSIWNASAAGVSPDTIEGVLQEYARYPVPEHVLAEVRSQARRFGRLLLERGDDGLVLTADDELLAFEVAEHGKVAPLLVKRSPRSFTVRPEHRGRLKQVLIKVGWPVRDLAGYTPGEPLRIGMRGTTLAGEPLLLRAYQTDAADAFHAAGNGVVVLPCGAGKTVVGMAAMTRLECSTLVLTTSISAVRQWIAELIDKTTLTSDLIGEYTGMRKQVRPVTVSTYQIAVSKRHLRLFNERNWGLIVYDEVHLLPAPVFQITAGLQARRRLGLTATLVREDGREDDVFALIGPKCAEVPWKELERQGWIAKAHCTEIRIALSNGARRSYAIADERHKFRIAAENKYKTKEVERILAAHPDDQALIMGMYVDQVTSIAKHLGIPSIIGSTPQSKRDSLYEEFRAGRLRALAVSKVANFAIDLPDASLAIQISGTFGSRQEEAQRLGRILRPKPGTNQAHFYSLVSHDTKEQEFAMRRQLFLCEQGYSYEIVEPEAPDSAGRPGAGVLLQGPWSKHESP